MDCATFVLVYTNDYFNLEQHRGWTLVRVYDEILKTKGQNFKFIAEVWSLLEAWRGEIEFEFIHQAATGIVDNLQ